MGQGIFFSSPKPSESVMSMTELDQQRKKSYKCLCCLKRGIHNEQIWMDYVLKLLMQKYGNFQWSKQIEQVLVQEQGNLDELSKYLIDDIKNKIYGKMEEDSSVNKFNIQFKRNKSQITSVIKQSLVKTQHSIQIIQDDLIRFFMQEFDVEDDLPNRANSLIEEDKKKQTEPHSYLIYKKAVQIIELHLRESFNPLNWLLSSYLVYFRDHIIHKGDSKKLYSEDQSLYESLLVDRKSQVPSSRRLIKKQINKIEKTINDIKAFIDFFLYCLYTFYRINSLFQEPTIDYFNFENLSLFIQTLLFRNDFLFNYLFNELSCINCDETINYQINLQNFYDQRPGFFGVPMHLELLQENVESIKQQEEKNHSTSNIQDFDCTIEQEMPYDLAIQQLQLLKQLKLISKTVELIQKSINIFYQRNNLRLINNFGADELVPIMVYVIVKSQVQSLGAILKIVENFTPRNILNSQAGYTLVTLQNCYYIIQSLQRSESVKKQKSRSIIEFQVNQVDAKSRSQSYQ